MTPQKCAGQAAIAIAIGMIVIVLKIFSTDIQYAANQLIKEY